MGLKICPKNLNWAEFKIWGLIFLAKEIPRQLHTDDAMRLTVITLRQVYNESVKKHRIYNLGETEHKNKILHVKLYEGNDTLWARPTQ